MPVRKTAVPSIFIFGSLLTASTSAFAPLAPPALRQIWGPAHMLPMGSPGGANRSRKPGVLAHTMMGDIGVDAMALYSQWHAATHTLAAAPAHAWAAYTAALERAPMLVDTGSASFLWALGKQTAASISKEQTTVRWLVNWAAIGVVDGVCTHSWYTALQAFADSNCGSLDAFGASALMTLTSSAVYTPCYMAMFLALLSLLEGKGTQGAMERVRLDFVDLTINTTKMWGPFNAFLFTFVPSHLRTLASMIFHYVFLIGLALWDSSVQSARAGALQERDSKNAQMLRRGRRLSRA